jgi:hypothetical protein
LFNCHPRAGGDPEGIWSFIRKGNQVTGRLYGNIFKKAISVARKRHQGKRGPETTIQELRIKKAYRDSYRQGWGKGRTIENQ